jgi:hypothetical protein
MISKPTPHATTTDSIGEKEISPGDEKQRLLERDLTPVESRNLVSLYVPIEVFSNRRNHTNRLSI